MPEIEDDAPPVFTGGLLDLLVAGAPEV
ncbi:hypothetical protein LY71_1171, partial [Geodermatophilus tzadiensis]